MVSLPLTATDNLGETLTFSASGLPTGLSIDGGTGLISGTIDPAADADGPYAVTVTATNGDAFDSQTFTWNVNNPVSVDPIGDQTNAVGDSVSLTVSATTTTGDTLSYSASDLPAGVSINSATGVISGTISAGDASSPYAVTVTANDGAISDSAYFAWTVSHLTLTDPGDQTNLTGDTVDLALSAQDNAGDVLTFSAAGLPPGLSINASTGDVSGVIAATDDADSPYTVTATVTGGGYSASQTFDWTVTRIAVVDPGDQNNADGDTVTLPIVAKDNNPDVLTYTATGLPPGLGINSATGLISGVLPSNADAGGPYVVTVTAGDAAGASASDTFFWSVVPLTLANPGDQVNAGGDAVSLQLAAQGPDGVALSYTAAGLPEGLTVNASTGLISGTLNLAGDSATPYSVTVTASDGAGASVSQSFTWSVDYLYAADPGDQSYYEGESVTLPIMARDNEGDTLSYAVSGLPAGLALSGAEIVGTVADSAVSANPYNIVVTVTNTLDQIATVAFAMNVADYTVTFGTGTVKTGYLIGADGKPAPLANPVYVQGWISDPTKLMNLQLEITGQADRVKLGAISVKDGPGGLLPTFSFRVDGLSATPSNAPGGDTAVEVLDGLDIVASVNVVVVIPAGIGKHPELKATKIAPENITLTSTSSPGWATTDPKVAVLVTAYVYNLKVPVVDQFGNALNDIYVGAAVGESSGGTVYPINQAIMAGGNYTDPVFPYQGKALIADSTTVAAKKEIADWPKDAKLDIPAGSGTQKIPVTVGGHPLNPAIKGRKVTWTADGTVTIEWPDD